MDGLRHSWNAGAHIGIKPIEELEAESRFSYSLPYEQPFAGGEIGLFLRGFPFKENFYFLLGYKLHWNQSRDMGRYNGYNGGLFKLVGLGVGLQS